MKKNAFAAILALFIFATCTTRAATIALPPELTFAPLLDASQMVVQAAAITTNRFPDADAVLVDDITREAYQPDGNSVAVDDEYFKVITEKGRRDSTVRSFGFDAAYETNTILCAEIIKKDGRHVTIDPDKNGRVMINPGQMGANIYNPLEKVFQLSIPGLEIDDMLHVTSLRTTFKTRVPDTWADSNLFESDSPVTHYTYEVVAPAGRPLQHIVLRDPVPNTVTYTTNAMPNGATLHRWDVHNVRQMFPEPDMPSMQTVVQRIAISTVSNWPALSKWYWDLSKPRLDAVTPEMRDMVTNLISGVTGRDDQIRRIFTFVSQKIRYMGITTETVAPGYEPHDVCMTFSNRYGVCRDKAALLVAMLRLADIDAYPVLINVGHKLDPDVPLTWFNHAIVAVRRDDGTYELMDPTNESTRDLCPAYLGNRSYLVAHPTGEVLRVSEVRPAESNLVRIATHGTLDEAGMLTFDVSVAFDGINDTAYRSRFLRQKMEERRRYFEGLLKGRLPGAELSSFELKPDNLMDTDTPLTAKLSGRVRNYPVNGEGATLLTMPWLASSIGYVNMLLGGATLAVRKYPYETGLDCGIEETIEITLGHDFGAPLVMPPDCHITRSGIKFTMTVGVSKNVLTGHYRHLLTQPEFTPAEYADMKKSLREIEYAARHRPEFAAVTKPSDTHVLADDLRIELADAHTWASTHSITRQVLTYAGKKRFAELHIPYNPIWQTMPLVSATVSNLDGSVHTVASNAINQMDAPWVGAASRYPAGKICVVSLPAIETGSVIRTTVRITQKDAPFFSMQHGFGGFDPVDSDRLLIRGPDSLPLKVDETDERKLKGESNASGSSLCWNVINQPATRTEEFLPPWHMYRPAVFVSTGDWKIYSREVKRTFEKAMHHQYAARDKARELVKGVKGERERIRIIRDFVAKAIREDGPSFLELPLACVTPADRTLSDGYGNQADVALLLATMLDAAGLDDVEPVLVSGTRHGGEKAMEIPQLGFYNQVLVAVELDDKIIYLGDTDQYDELGVTSHKDHPMLTLDGKQKTVQADALYDSNRHSTSWTINLDTNGTATITSTMQHFGAHCGPFRQEYLEMQPEDRRRHFQALVSGISQSAEAVGDLVTDTQSYPGVRTFTVKAPHYAVREGKSLTLLLPDAAMAPIPLRADQRVNPMWFDFMSTSEWTCTVILPPGVKNIPVLPPDGEWELPSKLGTITLAVTEDELPNGRKTLTFHRTIKLDHALVKPEEYPALLEINRQLSHPKMRTLMVELK
jgi:transglutaminase-like putative cysteine protease